MDRALIAAYVLLVPISWTPFPSRLQWSDIFFVAVFAYAVARGDLSRWRLHPVDMLVAAYLIASLPSFAATSDMRVTAIAFVKHVYLVLAYVVFSSLAIHRRSLRAMVDWLGISAVVAAGLGVLAATMFYVSGVVVPRVGMSQPLPYVGYVFRLYGPFHSPEMFASFLAFVAPIVGGAALAAGARYRRRWWVAVAVVLAAAVLTLGHALAGLAAAMVILLWRRWERGWYRALRAGLVVATVALVIGLNAMLVVSIREVRVEHGTNPRLGPPPYGYAFQPDPNGPPMTTFAVSYNWMSYVLIKKIAWETFRNAPLTGVGLGRFHDASERAVGRGEIHALYRIIDPHSTLMGRLAETGLLGGTTLVLLLGGFVWLAVKATRSGSEDAWRARALLAGLVGLLVASINVDVMNFRFLWLGFAVLRGLAESGVDMRT